MISDPSTDDQPLKSLYADDEMIAEILPAFVNNMPKYVGELRELIANKNWQASAKVCHDLKGTAGGYGYPQIGVAAQQLEQELKNSREPAALARHLQEVAKLCHQAQLGLPH